MPTIYLSSSCLGVFLLCLLACFLFHLQYILYYIMLYCIKQNLFATESAAHVVLYLGTWLLLHPFLRHQQSLLALFPAVRPLRQLFPNRVRNRPNLAICAQQFELVSSIQKVLLWKFRIVYSVYFVYACSTSMIAIRSSVEHDHATSSTSIGIIGSSQGDQKSHSVAMEIGWTWPIDHVWSCSTVRVHSYVFVYWVASAGG